MTNHDEMLGQAINTGRTGPKPRIVAVAWTGTAEANAYEVARVPAALITSDKGEMAVVRLAGNRFGRNEWWDARCIFSREWEDENGKLIAETAPHIATQVDAFFATATQHHEMAAKTLSSRVQRGKYAVT